MISVFVINLEKDYAKKNYISKLLMDYKIDFIMTPAVDGSKISQGNKEKVYNENQSNKNIGRGMSNGEIGCALSHLNIYKSMINNDIKQAIILEDDIFIDHKLKDFINVSSHIPEYIDLILLGYHSNQHTEKKSHASYWGSKNIKINKLVKLVEVAYGTYGYYITKNGAMKLIKLIEQEGISKPIDHYTGKMKILNTYATSDRLVFIGREFKQSSSIDNDRNLLINQSKLDKFKSIARKYKVFRLVRDVFHEIRFFIKAINPMSAKL